MRWPWKRSRGALVSIELPYARGRKIGRARWRVEVGQRGVPGAEPIAVDFWGTDEQARAYIEKENEEFARARAKTAGEGQRAYMIARTHRAGGHVGSVATCPRCRAVFGKGER